MKRADDRWVPVTVSVACVFVLGFFFCRLARTAPVRAASVTTVTQFAKEAPLQKIESNDAGAALPTDAEAVAGAIREEWIKPYGANTVYNRVCLQNKTDTPLSLETLLQTPVSLRFARDGSPEILLVHTHTTECYLPESRAYYTTADVTRTTDPTQNVCAVGDEFANVLQEAGFGVIHDTTVHDTTYTGSYKRSAATIKQYLEREPTIKLVIDLHRDSVSADATTKVKPVVKVQDSPAAQVMLVLGDGRGVSGFEVWEQNLALGVRFQQTMEVLYPGLARSVTFLNATYNQNLAPANLLLEVGTEANSVQEARQGGRLAAVALRNVLNTLTGS